MTSNERRQRARSEAVRAWTKQLCLLLQSFKIQALISSNSFFPYCCFCHQSERASESMGHQIPPKHGNGPARLGDSGIRPAEGS
ncbi:hypothetical protein HBH56_038760 [Parastagonospora nodorum]|nr:hypothetical protein HBH56_038760 [Parastagonospora nodorum]KAH3934064.1 hypothetical protein HBH54_060700 [Parastagonospora nodorum]KAH3940997.1 hypothetical protein HBH53_207580 [Parastagonospora nodorum]KAH3958932.1 hypothetical protein HBH52_247970 [Parastagonospora nodorum]KAH4039491.1 hypothetical protein HBI09_032730 [Parastagonospora nodorum]